MQTKPAIVKIDSTVKAIRSTYYTANKQKQNLGDKEWFTAEIKITKSAYKIAFVFTAILVVIVALLNILIVFEVLKPRSDSTGSSATLAVCMISLVLFTARLKAKLEELKTGNYLLELREDITGQD